MEITKTILWVEDFDNKDTTVPDDDLDSEPEQVNPTSHTMEIANNFPEVHQNRVTLKETVDSALAAIDNNFYGYDCVVLDVNMKEGWPNELATQKRVQESFSKAGVNFPDEIEHFKTNTGYYLYLYLLCKGFPKDRIIMRTAYNGVGNDNLTLAWDNVFKQAGLQPPINVGKADQNKAFHTSLCSLYPDENQYYLIRRLILDAANHWLAELNSDVLVADFVFNAAVTEEKKLTKEALCSLLTEINSLFTLRYDGEISDILSNVLRKLSAPFEAYANYTSVNKNENAFTYLSIMRLMRNWYAHNLFTQNAPSEADLFFLIIIAFRALFDSKTASMCLLDYEKAILEYVTQSSPLSSPDKTERERLVYVFYRETYNAINQLENLDSKYKSFSSEYWRLLDSLGQSRQTPSKCTYRKLVELIWTSNCPITLAFVSNPIVKQKDGYQDSIPTYINYPKYTMSSNNILKFIIDADYALNYHQNDSKAQQ